MQKNSDSVWREIPFRPLFYAAISKRDILKPHAARITPNIHMASYHHRWVKKTFLMQFGSNDPLSWERYKHHCGWVKSWNMELKQKNQNNSLKSRDCLPLLFDENICACWCLLTFADMQTQRQPKAYEESKKQFSSQTSFSWLPVTEVNKKLNPASVWCHTVRLYKWNLVCLSSLESFISCLFQ